MTLASSRDFGRLVFSIIENIGRVNERIDGIGSSGGDAPSDGWFMRDDRARAPRRAGVASTGCPARWAASRADVGRAGERAVMDAVLLDVITTAIRSVSKRTANMVITENSLLVEDLILDSLDLVGVLMKLEDHYGFKIELDEVPNIQTVADLGAHVEKLLGEQSAAA
jgi:acyl carrier protein